MELSRLAYLCIKNSVMLDDNGFPYEYYISNDSNIENSLDYSLPSNNVMMPINEAIARLSDLNRIPYKIAKTTMKDDFTVSLKGFDKGKVKEVVSVAMGTPRNHSKLDWSPFGKDTIVINGRASDGNVNGVFLPLDISFANTDVMVEFKEEIPYFFNMKDSSVELEDYGISDTMVSYIMEYVLSRITEQIEPALSQSHKATAEQYFSGLAPQMSAFAQKVTYAKYRI